MIRRGQCELGRVQAFLTFARSEGHRSANAYSMENLATQCTNIRDLETVIRILYRPNCSYELFFLQNTHDLFGLDRGAFLPVGTVLSFW